MLRLNDIVVGIVTGLISSVVAASIEAGYAYARIVSLGHAGGTLGSKLPIIAIVGAIVGGIIGLGMSSILKPRNRTT
ncbi:MAG: hypothetical protein GIW99_10395 [Candidatus Eremiobacteraeota bacterium]|nr:hypothetical protein [Candidatus Eremiobacteraeota bacterium]MBC5828071.1 hypothetical protein [Candidatus Eremiobacteraeota bacterium]